MLLAAGKGPAIWKKSPCYAEHGLPYNKIADCATIMVKIFRRMPITGENSFLSIEYRSWKNSVKTGKSQINTSFP